MGNLCNSLKKSRILFPVGKLYPAHSGGVDLSVYRLAKELSKDSEFNVTVVTRFRGISDEMRERYGVVPDKFIDIEGIRVCYFSSNRFFSLKMYCWFLRYLKYFDIVHISGFFDLFHVALIVPIARIYRKKVVISPRGELEEGALKFKKYKKLPFIKLFARYAYKGVPFHVTSDREGVYFRKYFQHHLYFTIPNIIEVKRDSDTGKKRKDILYLGRLHPIKGVELLIEAYSMLKSDLKGRHKLVIAGSGEKGYLSFLKKKVLKLGIDDRVEFIGHVEDKRKEEVFLNSGVFVLPSHSENFANVVIEAINYRVYVITSRHTPWEVLKRERIGSWIDNDPVAIRDEIEKVLNYSEEEYNSIINKARDFLFREFSSEKKIGLYKEMYRKVLRRGCREE